MLIKRKRVLSRSGQVLCCAQVYIELIVEALLIILTYPDERAT